LTQELTTVEEEYLEAIWHLERRNKAAKTSDLSQRLAVTMGTISNMIDHLEREGLLEHEHYRGVRLTPKGRDAALNVVRRHRLSEKLLTDILHIDWSHAHDAACKLEHSLTTEVTNSLDKVLGRPRTCPHGNPIPAENGEIVEEEGTQLSELKSGDKATVASITDEKTEMLQYLATLGLFPGTHVSVQEKAPFNGPLMIKVGNASYALSRDVASLIWVRKM
jgi:DtxR family Mn-dependent transcriptional regulator